MFIREIGVIKKIIVNPKKPEQGRCHGKDEDIKYLHGDLNGQNLLYSLRA